MCIATGTAFRPRPKRPVTIGSTISGNTVHHQADPYDGGTGLWLGPGVLATGNVVYGQRYGIVHEGSAGPGPRSEAMKCIPMRGASPPAPALWWPAIACTTTPRRGSSPVTTRPSSAISCIPTRWASGAGRSGTAAMRISADRSSTTSCIPTPTVACWSSSVCTPWPCVLNNTIYQPVGDAVRLEGDWVDLVNNLVWVLAGHDIYVTGASLSNLLSDYNLLHRGDDPNAHVGFAAGAVRDTLADWQTRDGPRRSQPGRRPAVCPSRRGRHCWSTAAAAIRTTAGSTRTSTAWNTRPRSTGATLPRPHDRYRRPRRVDDPVMPNLGPPDDTEDSAALVVFSSRRRPWARRWVRRPTMRSGTSRCRSPFLVRHELQQRRGSSTDGRHFAGPDPASSGDYSTPLLLNTSASLPCGTTCGRTARATTSGRYGDSGQVTICWNATNKADGSDVTRPSRCQRWPVPLRLRAGQRA